MYLKDTCSRFVNNKVLTSVCTFSVLLSCHETLKGQVIRATFPCNLSSNIVCASCKALLPVLPPPQATSGFVAKSRTEVYYVQHVAATCNTEICCAPGKLLTGVVMRQQSFATCKATMLRDKLQGNVARVTWPLCSFDRKRSTTA